MRCARFAVLAAALLLLPFAHGDPICGSIDETGATIDSGLSEESDQGEVIVDDCLDGGTMPVIPPIGDLGTIGDMTGDMPAFPGAGTGADGAFHATVDGTLDAGTHNFTTFTIDAGVTVTFTGAVVVHTTGNVDVQGNLSASLNNSPLSIWCGGDFAITGAGDIKSRGRLEIAVNGIFTGTAAARIYGESGGELNLTVHGTSPDANGIEADIACRLGSGSRDVVVRAVGDILVNGADIGASEGKVLLQSRQGSIKTREYAKLWGGESPGVYVEASTLVEIADETTVEPGGGEVRIAAFDGDLLVIESSMVETGSSPLKLHAAGMVKVYGATVESLSGTIEIVAYGGATVPGKASAPDVQVGPEPADGGGGGSVRTVSGDIDLRAARDAVVSENAFVTTDGGEIDIRAFGGDFRITGNGKLGADPADDRPIVVHASGTIYCPSPDSNAEILGSEVRLYSGDGGTEVEIPIISAESGPIVVLSTGPIILSGLLEAGGSIHVSTTDPLVRVQGAHLRTFDQSGTDWSGDILVECWGEGGTIDARDATIMSGDTEYEASGNVTVCVRPYVPPPPPPAVEAFFLPKRVLAKQNARKPERSKLIAAGFFDLGPETVDLTTPATLAVGGFTFDVPGLKEKGTKFIHQGDGVTFILKPHKTGSSRAKFKLKMIGDLTGKVDPGAVLEMRFANAAIDGRGAVTLTKGKYSHRKVRGTLVEPNLYLTRSKVKVVGAGKDALLLVIGLATEGDTPEAADVSIEFAGTKLEIAAGEFTRAGDRYDYNGEAGGIAMCRLDYAKEQMTLKAKGLDLGIFPDGAQAVLVVLKVGAEERAVSVRMVRSGKKLKY